MKIVVYEMKYNKDFMEASHISCIPFEPNYFQEYMRIYNECFFEMRKALGIEPYNYLSQYGQISDKVGNIYLLENNNELVGSVLCHNNEIDDLIVNKKYQHLGYGKELLVWGMQHIKKENDEPIVLHVAEWNRAAYMLYIKLGFKITNVEIIR